MEHAIFVEPRFLFAFSAHKAHLGFNPMAEALDPFLDELEDYEITKMGILKIPYSKSIPDDVVRRIALHRVKTVCECDDESLW